MNYIVGIDEVGRGPLAGPVVAAAVALPADYLNNHIRDSKKLTARNRDELYPIITSTCAAWAVVAVGHRRIEALNIRGASLHAMSLALDRIHKVSSMTEAVLVDGNALPELPRRWAEVLRYEAIVGGDDSVPAISAASIVAKVWRDRLMKVLGAKYPGYGFEVHAGYPTPQHRSAIASLGPSRVHRRTFRGVKEHLSIRPLDEASVSAVPAASAAPIA